MAYSCPICQKSYSTASHLRRHHVTHQSDRTFPCPFCRKGFLRQDVARRHFERCPNRQGLPVPASNERGPPRKACDNCAQGKLSCDTHKPCGNCAISGSKCLYRRLEKQPTAIRTHERPRFLSLATQEGRASYRSITREDSSEVAHGARSSTPFLSSFISSSNRSLRDVAYALETSNNSSFELAGAFDSETLHPDADDLFINSFSFSVITPLLAADQSPPGGQAKPSHLAGRPGQSKRTYNASNEILQKRATELISLVESSEYFEPIPPERASLRHQGVIDSLFTTDNVASFVDLFFQFGYRHAPIVHQPTFDIETVELPLLLSVFLIGSVWSYPRDTYFWALDLFSLAERFIFDRDFFRSYQNYDVINASNLSTGALSLLQAATLLVCIGFGLSDTDIRRRFRVHRFAEVLAAARSLNLYMKKEYRFRDSTTAFDWHNFIIQESCSRVAHYLYVLDCQYITFYATPPRIPIIELEVFTPHDEIAFLTGTAVLCETYLSSIQLPRLSLREVIRRLMEDHWDDLSSHKPFKIATFALYSTILALTSMIFTAKTQLPGAHETWRLQRALTRWKDLWDFSKTDHAERKHAGFMVRGEEVWLLAHKMLSSSTPTVISDFEASDMSQARRWLKELI